MSADILDFTNDSEDYEMANGAVVSGDCCDESSMQSSSDYG